MKNQVLGLHHITAIANNAQRNYYFYTHVFGLRMVKKSANFDCLGRIIFTAATMLIRMGAIVSSTIYENIGSYNC
jgi:glyoxalase family protein